MKPNQLTKTREILLTEIDEQLTELTADTDTKIEFVWDNLRSKCFLEYLFVENKLLNV